MIALDATHSIEDRAMSRPLKGAIPDETVAEHEMHDQEVLRANKELAAYFKGHRTEREARAALKIIKAFIRDRERADPRDRRPLPGLESTTVTSGARPHKIDTRGKSASGRNSRRAQDKTTESRLDESESVTNDALSRDTSSERRVVEAAGPKVWKKAE
jgi:hypothetical protein